MTEIHLPPPALLIIAVFSKHESALEWARARLEETFGFVALCSPLYEFNQTSYYESTMGQGLRKHFLAFRDLVPLDSLADIKLRTIQFEQELTGYSEVRPLNLDPGLLTLGKFMLATTKDQSHRIYQRGGIFMEVTLRYRDKSFEPWPWTYADYRQQLVLDFLQQARDFYRERLIAEAP